MRSIICFPIHFAQKASDIHIEPKRGICLVRMRIKLLKQDEDFKKYKSLITLPFGIVLVTGPTGSGKSTTLYSSLACSLPLK